MKKNLIFFSFVFVLLGCSENENFDASTIENEVKEMLLAYDDSVRKNGIEAEFFFLDNSDAFYWVPPGYKYALHYDSIATILQEIAPHYAYVNNNWDTLQILALSEKYATFNGVLSSTIITTDNDTLKSVLSETGIVVKRGNFWKLLSGQTVVINDEQ